MTNSFYCGFEGTLTGELTLADITIPTSVPGLFVSLKPTMILEFQCSLTFISQYALAAGLEYDDSRAKGIPGRIIWEAPHLTERPKLNLEGTLRIGLRGHLTLEYSPLASADKDYCLLSAGLNTTAALEFEGRPSAAASDGSEIHDCQKCVDITVQLAEEFGVELSAGFGFIQFVNDAVIRETQPLGSLYYSFDNLEGGLGRCPHRQYRLTVTAVDGRDYSLAELALLDPEQLIRDSNLAHRVPDCVLSIQDRSGKSVQSEDLITDGNGNVSVFLPSGEYTLTGYTAELYGTAGLRIDSAPRETALLLAAAETESGTAGALSWVFYPQSGLLAISGSGNMDDYAASGDGAAPWAEYKDRVKTVILRPGVKSVGENAFRSFRKLSSVQLPAGCASIGANAFRDLTRLDSVTIPKAVELVGQNAFSGCKALRRVVYDGSMGQWKDLKKNGIKSGNEPLLNAELVLTSTVIDKGQCGDALFWTLNSAGMLTISGTGAMYNYAPSEIPWADYRDLITGLTLEYGVSSLCVSAFSGCAKLAELSIPEGLNSLGASAFSGCTGLSRVELPDGLTSIPGGCFRNCRSLSAINLPYSLRSIGQDAFAGCNMGTRKSKDIFYEGTDNEWNSRVSVASGNDPLLRVLTTYSDELFASGSCGENLTWLLTSGGLLILDGWGDMTSHPWQNITVNNALYPTSNIKSIRIPEGVTSLCEYAFSGLSGLTKAEVPNSVQTIGQRVFQGCWNMTSLTVPFIGASREDSRTLGYLFGNGDKPEYSATIDGETIYRSKAPANLRTVRVTDAREIAAGAFYEDLLCNSNNSAFIHFKTILLNEGITYIGPRAFYRQIELESLILPDSLTSIGASCFYGCSSLRTISFPAAMTEVPDYMFSGCTGLTAYEIPSHVTRIGSYAFSGCSFTSFTIPDTVQEIGEKVFNGCWNMTNLTVPFIGASREDSRTLGYLFGNGDKSDYSATIDGEKIYRSRAPANLRTVRVTDAREIAAGAFYEDLLCNSNNSAFIYFKNISLNEGITYIGPRAFYRQIELESLILPDSLNSIGASCFYGCSSLRSISFPAAMTEIPDNMFYGCTGLTAYEIPSHVTRIGSYAFSGCSFTSFTIPDTVQEIGEKVFNGCWNMTSLTVPFIGASREDSRTLGYFFGNGNRTESSQTFNGEKVYRSTVPAYLRTIRVTDAKELAPGAFHGSLLVSPSYDFVLLSRITLNDGIETIGAGAFTDQSQLTSFYFPACLTGIGGSAFSGCRGLTEATFGGSMAEWLSVSIESGNAILSQIPIRCSDGVLLNGEEIEDPDAGKDAASPEDPAESAGSSQGETGGSIGPVEPVIKPVPTEAPDPVTEPTPTEDPDPAVEPVPSEEPAPTEDPGYIGLASFSGESAPVDDTVYSASFAGLVPGEQYVLLITGEDVEDLDLRFASILFIAQEAAGEDGTLRFSYVRLPSETAPVIRLYGRSDKDLGDADALGLVMHKGVSDPKAYSVHVSYEGTELKENEDFILSMEKRANGIIAVTVKGIRAYSGSRTVLAKETCLEAAETPDGYAVIHTAHSWGAWGESTATCEEPGEKARSCSVCGKTESESTEPIGHLWGEPSWTWTEDLTGAEASFTCAHDSSHVTTLEASITPDGEDEYGVFYTAAVVFQGETYSDSRYLRLYLPGDLNRDGDVDSRDLLRLRQMLVGTEMLSAAGDLNGDGTVDILDLVRFRKYLAGEDVILFDPKG